MSAEANASIRKVIVIYNPRSGTLLAAGDDPEAPLRKLHSVRAGTVTTATQHGLE